MAAGEGRTVRELLAQIKARVLERRKDKEAGEWDTSDEPRKRKYDEEVRDACKRSKAVEGKPEVSNEELYKVLVVKYVQTVSSKLGRKVEKKFGVPESSITLEEVLKCYKEKQGNYEVEKNEEKRVFQILDSKCRGCGVRMGKSLLKHLNGLKGRGCMENYSQEEIDKHKAEIVKKANAKHNKIHREKRREKIKQWNQTCYNTERENRKNNEDSDGAVTKVAESKELAEEVARRVEQSIEEVVKRVEETIEEVVVGWEVFMGDEARVLEDVGELLDEVEDWDQLYWVKPRFYCLVEACGKRFIEEGELARHNRRKHGHPKIDCGTCGWEFSSYLNLEMHLMKKHQAPKMHKRRRCEEESCSQKFLSQTVLEDHGRSKHGHPKLQCTNCRKQFKLFNSHQRHISKMTCQRTLPRESRGPYSCKKAGCDKIFLRKRELKAHVRTSHIRGFVPYTRELKGCEEKGCDKKFVRKEYLQNHLRAQHGHVKLKCTECHQEFTQPDSLAVHIRTAHMGMKLVCPIENCDRKFTRKGHLSAHIKVVHKGLMSHKCRKDKCGGEFATKRLLKAHLISQHGHSKFRCPEENCVKEFKFKGSITNHIKVVHRGENIRDSRREVFQCEQEGCGAEFATKNQLQRHLRSVHGHAKVRCPVESCLKEFTHPSTIPGHVRTVHLGIKEHKCDEVGCGARFSRKRCLHAHNLSKHGKANLRSTTLKCPEPSCNSMQFTERRQLEDHGRKDHNHPKLACPEEGCGKKFFTYGALMQHKIKKKREKKRNFTCPEPSCTGKFASRCHLEDHGRAKHSHPMLICPVEGCGMQFIWSSGHRKHKAKKHQKLTCPVEGCGKQFLWSSGLRNHKATMHQIVRG